MSAVLQTVPIVHIKNSKPFIRFQKRILFFVILLLIIILYVIPGTIAAAEKSQKPTEAAVKDDEDVSDFIIPAPDACFLTSQSMD